MKLLSILSFFLFIQISFSQQYELGKVTIEELKEKRHPKDSTAEAAIIYTKGKSRFEYIDGLFYTITTVEKKIKIYKKEGLDWANFQIGVYVGGQTKEIVTFSKAVTYNLVNGAIEKTKLKSEGEFTEKNNDNYDIRKISLPNVKEGSVIEFKYDYKSVYWQNLESWKFQYHIPVNYSEYVTYIPEFFIYNKKVKGYFSPVVTETSKKSSFNFFSRDEKQGVTVNNPGSTMQSVDYNENISTYKMQNVPALKDEAFVNNINNYTSAIVFELSGTRFPNSMYKSYANTWESVIKYIYSNENFGSELSKKSYFEDDVNAIVKGLTNDDEKSNAIFDFVKNKMTWNDNNSYYCKQGVKAAYKNNTGNVAEINLMLVAMMRHAGLNANPILISTRSNGISIFPSNTAYNYVICGLLNGSKTEMHYFDATSKNAQRNILPFRDLNWYGELIQKDGTSIQAQLTPAFSSQEVVNSLINIDKEGKASGKIRHQYYDYNGLSFREQFNKLEKDSYLEKLEKAYNGIEINDYECANKTDGTKPIIENYSFNSNNSIEIIGNKMYFSPMMFFSVTKNPFTAEKREYPIDFVYPNEDKYQITINIPESYAIESIPQPKAFVLGENALSFKYNIAQTDNQVQISVQSNVNTAILSAEYYEDLKSYYNELIKTETEKVVLVKK
jgi:transglutaminase-like putative cysteine protease